MATITICKASGWLLALVLCGCGGGDFQVGADVPATPTEPRATAGQAVGPAAAAAAASAPGAGGGSALRIHRPPQGIEVVAGEVAQFGVEVEGPPAVTYQWLRDEQPIDGETGPVLRLRTDAADHLARISVIVRAGGRTVRSDAAVLRVG